VSFRSLRASVTALLLATSTACASRAIPELPSQLEEHDGLLVARLYVLGLRAMENASVQIDGREISSAMRNGYIAIPLPAGEHRLSQFKAMGQLLRSDVIEYAPAIRPARVGYVPTDIYIPGASRPVHYTTLGADRSFRIEAGRVTNLGLMVYLPVVDPPDQKRATTDDSRRFNTVTLDNGVETSRFLETNYPELVRSLRSRDLLLAPGKYVDPAKLPDVRRAIAYHELKGPNVVATQTRAVVYGRAATIVVLTRGPNDKDTHVEVLDTGTLADVVGAVRHGDRYTFVTSDAKALSWDGQALTRAPLPERVQPLGLHPLGERGLMVIDMRMRILTAREPGAPWVDHQALMVGTPRDDVSVATEDAGDYISIGTRGLVPSLYYLKAGESVPQRVQPPDSVEGDGSLGRYFMVTRRAGLFVFYDSAQFLFRSKATQQWARHYMPNEKCKGAKLDDEGREFTVECEGVKYRSVNSGATWSSAGT